MMRSLIRRFTWWLKQRRKEAELSEELQFHLSQEAEERQADGLTAQEARWAAQRDLGNEARLREDARAIWTWRPLEELTQDLRYGLRTMFKNRAVTTFAVLSLALGIGANTAIYSFMDSILMRSLPVSDPESLVVMTWTAKPFAYGRRATNGPEFVLHSINGSFNASEASGRIFPFAAFERLQQTSSGVLSSIFAYFPGDRINVMVDGEAELAQAQYVSGDFFGGLAVSPAAGRLVHPDDDRTGAPPVVVISDGYSQRRFGSHTSAINQQVLINGQPFTVIGVTPSEFFGVDPGAAPQVYLPMRAKLLLDADDAEMFTDPNYYWAGIMARLRPGVSLAQAEAALATPFAQWVAPTAGNDRERANLPVLKLAEGAGGLDSLRRKYSKPIYLLLAIVGLILAIACANTANLLLARATARRREIAVRLSIGAGRFRLIRQLLTESLLLASIAAALGVAIAVAGMRLLTLLLANGDETFTLRAELNWRVLLVTLGLAVLCGVLFGLAPAIQSTRPAVMPALRGLAVNRPFRRRGWIPRLNLTDALVVTQISILLLLLTGAALFVRTLSNLQHIQLGFNRENVLLFELNAPQAGYPAERVATFYSDLRTRLAGIPGVRAATLSNTSLIQAGWAIPTTIDGAPPPPGTRLLQTGPGFFTTMQIPMLQGREIDERDRQGAPPVAVISDLFARTVFPGQNPLGRHLRVGRRNQARDLEIVGVAATARYGGLKHDVPPVAYLALAQMGPDDLEQATFALRTDGDPLHLVATVRQIVRDADTRVPVTNIKTQAAEIDQSINQEIVLARLCTAFAILALVIACAGLYGTMAYTVARRTNEIGIRMALGARRGAVMWMVLRRVCVLAALGLAISVPIARGSAKLIESFMFNMTPNDPRALAVAAVTLAGAALLAGYGPARRASRIDPMTALRHD
jgi:macrolide transport system ATP-binding/permease protein